MYKAAVISLFIGLVVANQNIIEYQQTGVVKPSHQRFIKLTQTGSAKPSLPNDVKLRQAVIQKPAFCNDLDCPTFTEVEDFGKFEERRYSPSAWVTTTMTGMDYKKAGTKMFMKLFGYIQGQNEDGQKIKMTAPVITRIIPGQGPACENNFTMSFFISSKLTNPPKPTDASIFIQEIPEQTVYVRHFGGYARNYEAWKDEALVLAADLKTKDLIDYETDYYYTCGYNSPFQIFNRHNEVWFLKK